MAFQSVNYECDDGAIGKIRLSDEKLALAGAPPTGAAERNLEVIASPSGRTRRYGVFARGVRGSRSITVGTEKVTKSVFIPCLTAAQLSTLLTANTFTYKGNAYTSLKAVPEN